MSNALTAVTPVAPQTSADPTAFGSGGMNFSWGDHICAIFDDPDQQMRVMVPFISQGLRAAQRCVWIAGPEGAARFRRALAESGGDLPTLEASGQLIIIPEVTFYSPDGLFDPERTLGLAQVLLEEGRRSGWSAMRVAGDASFLCETRISVARWESYEEEVTHRIAAYPVVAVCQYLRRCLPSTFISAAFRTHPIVIVGESIYEVSSEGAGFASAVDRRTVS